MARLVGKLDDLVLNRGAVARTDPFDLSGIERRLRNVRANRVVNLLGRIADVAVDLLLLETVSSKREWHWRFVAGLWLKRTPVDRSAVQSWRRSRLEATNRKTEPFQSFGKLN